MLLMSQNRGASHSSTRSITTWSLHKISIKQEVSTCSQDGEVSEVSFFKRQRHLFTMSDRNRLRQQRGDAKPPAPKPFGAKTDPLRPPGQPPLCWAQQDGHVPLIYLPGKYVWITCRSPFLRERLGHGTSISGEKQPPCIVIWCIQLGYSGINDERYIYIYASPISRVLG